MSAWPGVGCSELRVGGFGKVQINCLPLHTYLPYVMIVQEDGITIALYLPPCMPCNLEDLLSFSAFANAVQIVLFSQLAKCDVGEG
jgi:hypothetical protein